MSHIMRDLSSNISPVASLVPAARGATANGTGVDLRDYAAVSLHVHLGTFAGTTPTATIRWEESDDDSTYTAVAAADLDGGTIAGIDGATGTITIKRGYLGTKRYARAALTAIAGSGASLPCVATVVRSSAAVSPVNLIGG